MSNIRRFSQPGLYLYAFGSFAAGVCDLIWGNFDSAHQPLQAWGDNIPGATVFAYITGVGMVAGSVALLFRQSERIGGAVLAAIYFIFALFWLPRFYTAPHYLGIRIPVYIGVFSGVGIELIAFAAGVLVWASLEDHGFQNHGSPRSGTSLAMRWVFGICAVGFGLQHLTNIPRNLEYVPKWLPPGAEFWVVVTGICFVLAGLAILTRVLDALAAWLLGLMFRASISRSCRPTFLLTRKTTQLGVGMPTTWPRWDRRGY
jgi:uncharacterized membrane protein